MAKSSRNPNFSLKNLIRDNLVFSLGELLVLEPLVLNVLLVNVILAAMTSEWRTK